LKFIIFLIAAQAHVALSQTPQQDVVTSTKFSESPDKLPRSVEIINSEEIDNQQSSDIVDVLRKEPELTIKQNGSGGQSATVSINGANSEHTLVLIDGIPVNDPSSPANGYDFSFLSENQASQIEIMEGNQSTLHGSNAIGGIINIITVDPSEPFTNAKLSYGSFENRKFSLSTGSGRGDTSYKIGVHGSDSIGQSAASESAGNTELDGHKAVGGFISGTKNFDNYELKLSGKISTTETETDDYGGEGGDDENSVSENTHTLKMARVKGFYFEDSLITSLTLSQSNYDRKYSDPANTGQETDLEYSYIGNTNLAGFKNILIYSEAGKLVAGVDHSVDSIESDEFDKKEQTTIGNYIYVHHKMEPFVFDLGIRNTFSEKWGEAITYDGYLSYSFMVETYKMRVKGGLSSGFKAPSLYQTYSNYGDESLKSEESVSKTVGVDFVAKRITLSSKVIQTKLENLIQFTDGYENIGEASITSHTHTIDYKERGFMVNRAITFIDAKDGEGEKLLGRPETKAITNIFYKWDVYGVGGSHRSIGKRIDTVNGEREKGQQFEVFEAMGHYNCSNYKLGLKVSNLLDTDYEEVTGYTSPGRSYTASIGANF
jgi:vitamin B12 transporter